MGNIIQYLLVVMGLNSSFASLNVRIQEGIVSGTRTMSRNGREIYAFYGIPYAEPPVGELRFRSPVPKAPWHGVYRAHKPSVSCIQFQGTDIPQDEDCLFLNVYTPQFPKSRQPLLPVMVFIYGGSFLNGTSSPALYGSNYLLDGNVILVTMNYRVGIFGFLSTEDEAAPGNYGLKDQLLALQWVNRNIKAFGGDPRRVTLLGQSAGSMSVQLHTLSDKSTKYFHQYILHSGLAVIIWSFHPNVPHRARVERLARAYNCSTATSATMVNCLRTVDTYQINNNTWVFDDSLQMFGVTWGPTIEPEAEDAFLTEDALTIMNTRKTVDMPVMTGNIIEEGLLITIDLYTNDKLYETYADNIIRIMEQAMMTFMPVKPKNITDVAKKMKEFYLGVDMPQAKNDVILGITEFITDLTFLYPQVQWLQYMVRNKEMPLYVYIWKYLGTLHLSLKAGKQDPKIAGHSDELFYLFPMSGPAVGLSDVKRTETDYEVVDYMVNFWTSYVEHGVPVSPNITWESYRLHGNHIQIGNHSDPTVTTQHSILQKRMDFWHENVPSYFKK